MLRICFKAQLILIYGKTGNDIKDQINELPGEESNITSKVDKNLKNWDKGFKIGHVNIRSLVKNIDQLRIYLSNQQYDIRANFFVTKISRD